MPANTNITGFKTRVDTSIRDIDQLNGELSRFSQTLTKAAQVVKAIDDTGDVAGFIRKASEDQLLVLKLTKQAAPLKGPSQIMETAIKLVKPIAERIEKTVDRLNGKKDSSDPDSQEDKDGEFLNKLETALSSAAFVLNATVDLLEFQRQSMSDLSGTMGLIVNAMDTATKGGSGSFAFPGDRQKSIDLKADFDGLNFAVGAELAQRNVLIDDIRADYLQVRQQFADILSIMDAAKLDLSLSLDVDLSAIEGFFSVLAGPLDAAAAALQPVEGLLNSVGALVDLVLGPVFAFLEATLGIDDLLEKLADDITDGLPNPAVFDAFEAQVQSMLDDLRTFITDNFGVEEFINALEVATFGTAIGDATQGTIGTGDDRNETLWGDGSGDVLDARGGDDTINALGGNDIILATAGDDTIDGGTGDDMLFFDASFSEFELSRDYREDSAGNVIVNDIVVTHTAPADGALSFGSERFRNIEWVVFNNITFTGEELENATIGSTLLEGDRADVNDPTTANTFVRDDLIFLNSDGDPNADGTADGLHEAAGYAGDDRIFGSTGNDLLRGGTGNDILIPGRGNDVVRGDAGNDSFQALSEGLSSIEYIIDLIDGVSRSQFGTDTLITIENTIIQTKGNHQIRGDNSANRILTADGLDRIDGRDGNDYIEAGGGKDVLIGGQGRDYLNGGEGNDVLIVAGDAVAGGEIYDGASGSDALLYSHSGSIVSAAVGGDSQVVRNGELNTNWLRDLDETTGSVRIFADTGLIQRYSDGGQLLATDRSFNIETFGGSLGNDIIYGHSYGVAQSLVNPSILGSGGNDILYLRGADSANGGGGDDQIFIDHWVPESIGGQSIGGGGGYDVVDLRPGGDLRWEINVQGGSTFTMHGHLPSSVSGVVSNTRNPEYRLKGNSDIELIRMGEGNDQIRSSPGGGVRLAFDTGGGDDEIEVLGGFATIYAGAGEDKGTFNFGGAFYGGLGADSVRFDVNVDQGSGLIDLGADDDYALVLGMGSGSASGGSGYDTLSSESSRGLNLDLVAGTLSDKATGLQRNEIDITIDGFERVITSGSADNVKGSHRTEVIVTKGGNDVITAGSGDDQIYGGNGNDNIRGEAGDDLIHGGPGTNYLNGGSGRNTISYENATPDNLFGRLVAAWFNGVNVNLVSGQTTGTNLSDTFENFQDVIGSRLSDTLRGDHRDNVLSGGLGNDTMFGGSGNDYLLSGEGTDSVSGESGDDTILVERGSKTINGGSGTDTLDLGFSGGRLVVDLQAGTYSGTMAVDMPDWLDPNGPPLRTFNGVTMSPLDVLRADPLYSLSETDKARVLPTKSDPAAGQFALTSVTQFLTASGTFSSVERFVGSKAETFVRFGTGFDRYDGRRGDDDWIYMHNEADGFTYDMASGFTNLAELQGDTLLGMENLWGGNGNDFLLGDDNANQIKGGRGNDRLDGRGGDDTLISEFGGTNEMRGGTGNDIYRLLSGSATLVEFSGGGVDLVETNFDHTLGTHFENLRLLKGGTGTGNAVGNNIEGSGATDIINGLGGNDWLTPGAGNDTVDGGAGVDMVSFVGSTQGIAANLATDVATSGGDTNTIRNIENLTGSIFGDYIEGDAGSNRLRGLGDYDWFIGTAGNDSYDGGTGLDMISYIGATSGVTVSLADNGSNTGLAAGDRYENVERVTGSSFADTFYGDSGQNDFRGLGGYDTFFGSAGGRERYDGGSGLDTVSYAFSNAGVVANLATGYGSGGDAARDLYTSIENLGGTSFADSLTGNNDRNNLRGLGGDDFIFGNGGIDRIYGGRGNDTIDGGAGSDYILYDGDRADYQIVREGSTRNATVEWIGPGNGEGFDTLTNVEYFVFDDQTVNIWSL